MRVQIDHFLFASPLGASCQFEPELLYANHPSVMVAIASKRYSITQVTQGLSSPERASPQRNTIRLGLLDSIGQQSTFSFHRHAEGVSGLATHPAMKPNAFETLPIRYRRTPSNRQTCFSSLPCSIHDLSSHALLRALDLFRRG